MIAALSLVFGLACASAQPPPQSLFGNARPATVTDPDTSKVELGTRFTVKTEGTVTAIRFYKGPQNTGTHVGKLYADGKEVARVTFRNETREGWQVDGVVRTVIAGCSWHTYGGRWEAGRIRWYYDGVLVFDHQNANVTNQPMYLICNLAGSPSTNPSPASMPFSAHVDYIRAWSL